MYYLAFSNPLPRVKSKHSNRAEMNVEAKGLITSVSGKLPNVNETYYRVDETREISHTYLERDIYHIVDV